MSFWKIIIGIGILFTLFLYLFTNSDLSLSGVDELEAEGLDQPVVYLSVGEPCGYGSSCKPGLICERPEGYEEGGGICVRPDIKGPHQINPDID